MRHFTLFCSFPSYLDNCAFYRGHRPYYLLKKLMPLTIIEDGAPTWGLLSACDAVFLQRPHRQYDLDVATLAHKMRIPIIVDYDDDMLSVPLSNPNYHGFRKDKIGPYVEEICSMASVITVSTKHLATVHPMKDHPNVRIIPNAYDDYLLGTKKKPFEFSKQLFWRGTMTHEKDLLWYGQSLVELQRKYTDWIWNFAGYIPWQIVEQMEPTRVALIPFLEISGKSDDTYFNMLRKWKHSLQIVPLWPCDFNYSKSNIAWIEATYAASACLAPDWPEWQVPGVITYSDQKEFHSKFEAALTMPEDVTFENARDLSWDYMMGQLRLSLINDLRKGILMDLI